MTKSRRIFQIVIQAPTFTQMLLRDYSFKKCTRAMQKFKMATIFFKMATISFKMADMSCKEIIKFAKKCAYLSNMDDGVKSYSLEHVEK